MERITKFLPAWDRRSNDPKKDRGVHSAELVMVLKGELGATQFKLITNWYLPHIHEEWDRKKMAAPRPIPADLGYHSPKPLYEGQTPIDKRCPYVNGGVCYYDGSSLAADNIFNILREKGSEAVWAELEKSYVSLFGDLR